MAVAVDCGLLKDGDPLEATGVRTRAVAAGWLLEDTISGIEETWAAGFDTSTLVGGAVKTETRLPVLGRTSSERDWLAGAVADGSAERIADWELSAVLGRAAVEPDDLRGSISCRGNAAPPEPDCPAPTGDSEAGAGIVALDGLTIPLLEVARGRVGTGGGTDAPPAPLRPSTGTTDLPVSERAGGKIKVVACLSASRPVRRACAPD
jgi:hypothetical protein